MSAAPRAPAIDATDPVQVALLRCIDTAEAWHRSRREPDRRRACDAVASLALACGLPPERRAQIAIAVSALLDQPERPGWLTMRPTPLDPEIAAGTAQLDLVLGDDGPIPA